ncbi:hypothetical protein P5F43_15010 [Clostridium perfringens]|uniref:hypothetical protein n=1 Tax=Clostridium TaxID=1485 RepID=UPI0022E813DA|nr:hypothetical protein [Clostridium baratii]EGT4141300.1 hypothetical protein [Clostridium perfringens]MDK0888290.1 hypothetical protein [Clostridium perfringens]WVM62252.1 hypothetical protein V1657_16060 [Clostridium perfringens]
MKEKKSAPRDSYILTFSRKNLDVKKIINQKIDKERNIFTDYICEAVRFYEKYKDNINSFNNFDIEKIKVIIDERIEEKLKNFQLKDKDDKYENVMNKELDESFLDDD